MPRPRHLSRSVLPAALALAMLSGCTAPGVVPTGEPFPDPPTTTVFELLGIESDPEAATLDAGFPARIAALAEQSETFARETDAQLARAIAGGPATNAATASFTASSTTGTPGVDVPVITQRGTTTTDTSGGRPTTISTTSTSTISDQREVTVHESVGTTGDPESGRGSIETLTTTSRSEPCAAEGEPAGDFEVVMTRHILSGPVSADVTITTSGTVVPQPDGTITIRDARVVLHAGATGADNAAAPPIDFTVNAEIRGWSGHGDLTDTHGEWSATTGPGVPEESAIKLGGGQLDAFNGVASDVVRRAEELRERGGVCVRIIVDTHGETTLADGDEARIDARVIDPATGEEIPDAVVEAESQDGSVSPASATGHGTFTFTASGDPDYRVHLSTRTPRGGHRATVRYSAPGWQFEGLSYGYTIPGDIAVEITWSGRVCGDHTGDWQLDWQIRSAYGSPNATGTQRPVELDSVTHGDRAILVYQEVPSPADGEPPFRLWLDDENSGKMPAQQRVEIHPEPLDGPCTQS
ncbi:MAG: hypothetical protein ACTHMQ_03595 [Protaetiibacter sp.]